MFTRIALCALIAASPALAADGPDLHRLMAGLSGQYGAEEGSQFSCDFNPVTLDFTESPAHARFHWNFPSDTVVGRNRLGETYDLIGPAPGGLAMRLERDPRRTDDGAVPIWILRPDADFSGFCWGRADWPLVRCVAPHHRCGDPAPTS